MYFKRAANMHRYLVLASAVICHIIIRGQFAIVGRLFVSILETFNASRAQTGALLSAYVGVFRGFGVVSGLIVQRCGPKLSGALASLVASVAFISAFWGSSIYHLIVALGAIAGLCGSIVQLSCLSAASKNFEGRSKFVALALIGVGPGVGGMLYVYVVDLLLYKYGLRGTFLITGGFTLNAFALTLAWTSTPPKTQVHDAEDKDTGGQTSSVMTVVSSIKRVLVEKPFLTFIVGFAVTKVAQKEVLIFITDLLQDNHADEYVASLAILLNFFASTISGLLVAFVKFIPHFSTLSIPLFATLFGVTGSLSLVIGHSSTWYLIGSVTTGLSDGLCGSTLMSIAAIQTIGTDNMVAGVGFAFSVTGVCFLVSGPLLGYIKDVTGSYTPVYYTTAAATCVGGVLFLVALMSRRCRKPTTTTASRKLVAPTR